MAPPEVATAPAPDPPDTEPAAPPDTEPAPPAFATGLLPALAARGPLFAGSEHPIAPTPYNSPKAKMQPVTHLGRIMVRRT